jgi:hypothetical protein
MLGGQLLGGKHPRRAVKTPESGPTVDLTRRVNNQYY